MMGSHGLYQKQLPYEESINIPLIVHDPRLPPERRGTVVDAPVCTEDLYPTTLGLAGAAADASKPGLDLGPCIRGAGTPAREGVYLEFVEEDRPPMPLYGHAWRGLRTRRWKYVVLDGQPWMLFDLAEDPFEMNNLAASHAHAGVRRELHETLKRRAIETHDSYEFAE